MLLRNGSLENRIKKLIMLMILWWFQTVIIALKELYKKVFPYASHGVCAYHLKQNLKTRFKSVVVHKLFNDVAYTYHLA